MYKSLYKRVICIISHNPIKQFSNSDRDGNLNSPVPAHKER